MSEAAPQAPSSDAVPDEKAQGVAALDRLRAMTAEELQASGALVEELAGSIRDPQFRARVNAYRAIIERDLSGQATGHSRSVTEATLELNELMGFSRRYDVGKEVLSLYMDRWPTAANLRKHAVVLSGYTQAATPFRDVFSKDVQIVPHPGASATLLVFCGIRHLFGFSLNVLHHCWLGARSANVIYLRDFHETLYLQGFKSVGDQTASLAYLRGAIEALGAPKLVCIGNSGGVLGALHYGSMLHADSIIGYSGPSSVEIGLQFEAKQSYKKLAKLQNTGQVTWPDVRGALAEHPYTRVRMFYAGDHEADRPQAENLAGLANVSLEPLPGESEHFIIDQLILNGSFGGSLDEAINTPPNEEATAARMAASAAPLLANSAAIQVEPVSGGQARGPQADQQASADEQARSTQAARPHDPARLGRKARARGAARAATAAGLSHAPTLVPKPPRNAKGHEAARRGEERHAGQKPDVVIIGDSRAAMWPKTFTTAFGDAVANLGISGSTVPVMAWKVNTTAVDLSTASTAIVLAGVNDLRMSDTAPAAIAESIADLAGMIRMKAPKATVCVFEIFTAKPERRYTEERRIAVNERLEELAGQGAFRLLKADMNDAADQATFKDDGLHLRPKAYRKLMRIVSDSLSNNTSKPAPAAAPASADAIPVANANTEPTPNAKPGKRARAAARARATTA